MKYGMPRKIDDERRRNLLLALAIAAAAAAAAWTGYKAWMRPFEERRAHLGQLIREGETFLDRLEKSLAEVLPQDLEAARTRLAAISAGGTRWDKTELPGFRLESELYMPADRMRAERLQEEYTAAVSEFGKGRQAVRAAAKEADGLSETIGSLLGSAGMGAAAEARSDLSQSLLEMKAVHAQARPSEEVAAGAEKRFGAVQRKAAESRAGIAKWRDAARQALADAKAVEDELAAAEKRTRDAVERSRVLRKEGLSLQIDQNSAKLTTLLASLQKGRSDTETALASYKSAKAGADAALGETQKKARETCQAVRTAIQRLVAEHGSLLPEAEVQEGEKAPDELEAAIRGQDEAWYSLGDKGAELVRRTETLLSEAGALEIQLETAQKTGEVTVDGARASSLPGELADVRGQLVSATDALNGDSWKRKLDGITDRAENALKAVRAAKPDIPKLLAGIRGEAATALKEIERAQTEKDLIANRVKDGRGESKAALEQALAACLYPDGAQNELRQLAEAEAASGRGIQTLRARLAKALEAVRAFSECVGQVRKDQAMAEASGRFFPVSWVEGAIGWEPGKAGVVTDQDASVLVPIYNGVEGNRYLWEFDLPFASAGSHRIEVKVAKPGMSPVNESIDRLKRAVHDGQSVNGGWIGVECSVKSPGGNWSDELWIPNYNKLPAETVVEGTGTFGAGYQTFTLNLTLFASPATGNNFGWHPGRLEFTVFVDGQQVRQFWHKSR